MLNIKKGIRGVLSLLPKYSGIQIFKFREGYHYVPEIYGRSAYKMSSILELPVFGKLADKEISSGRSCLYYDRLYTIYQGLDNLKCFFPSKNEINIAEVGVYKGGTSHFIASTIQALNIPNASLHSFDTFEGHPEEDVKEGFDANHKAYNFNDTSYDSVRSYLKDFNNVHLYKGRVQETCDKAGVSEYHLVHLDVDIYEPTRFGLDYFDKYLAVGGMILVDDYGFVTCPGAKRAADEFIQAHPEYFHFHLLSGQLILVKTIR